MVKGGTLDLKADIENVARPVRERPGEGREDSGVDANAGMAFGRRAQAAARGSSANDIGRRRAAPRDWTWTAWRSSPPDDILITDECVATAAT